MAYGRFEVFKRDLTLTDEQVLEYSAQAEKHYRPDFAYHNWNHALEVAHGTEVISNKLETRGLTVARGALAVAAAWHDAGYHEDHKTKGFETKELYSAALLDEFLEDKPVGELEKAIMRTAIIATWAGHKELRTPYELIMHRSDTANIGGPTDEFLQNSLKLHDETEFITDKPLSWQKYVDGAAGFIKMTADEHDRESTKHLIDIKDTTIDVHDMPFSQQALLNLEALKTFEPKG